MVEPMSRPLVAKCCGYDYCVCGQHQSLVEFDDLDADVKIRHYNTVIGTMVHAHAVKADIDAMRSKRDELVPT